MPPLPWSALLASGTYWVSWTSKGLANNANHQGASEVPSLPWPQSASANSEGTLHYVDRDLLLTHLK